MKKWNYKLISIMMFFVALFLTTVFFFGCSDQQGPVDGTTNTSVAQAPNQINGDFEPGELLVKFKPITPAKTILTTINRHGVIKDTVRVLDVKVLKIPVGKELEKIAVLNQNPNIEYAEPNYIAYATETPSDPSFINLQWGMTKIQAPQAWNVTHGNSSFQIAILDTGIDQDHNDLAGKIVANVNFSSSATFDDIYGHGTHCAGIAAAITNNGIGVAGVGYACSLMNVKVLGDNGSGSDSGIANGIIWAADNGARVISMSFGGSGASRTLKNAVNYAWGKGCVIVAAAGNNNTSRSFYPAFYANCIAVGATDQNDNRASFSNYGKSWVDVAAPGVNIYSTFPNSKYGYMSGTSMATPHVAGLAGLLWSTGYGTASKSVRNRIESTCDPVGNWVAHGRINAFNAVAP